MADTKISALPSDASIGGSEELPVNDAGTNKKVTTSQLKTYCQTGIDHTTLSNIGTNTHSQIDTHLADTTIHQTTEQIQDSLGGSFLQAGAGLSGAYDDTANTYTYAIANDGVTLAKIQNLSANTIIGNPTGSTGDPQEITCTAAGRALLDDADASAQRTTLGLGSLSVKNTVGTVDIDNDAVDYAKIQNVSATDRVLGRVSTGAGNVEEITCTAAGRALLDDADASAQRTTLGLGSLAVLSTVTASEISNNAVTDAKLRDSAALSVIGNATNTSADPADINAGTDGHVLRRSGTSLGFGTIATAGIANDAVDFTKIQNISTNRLVGRSTAGSGDLEEISIGTNLTLNGGTLNASQAAYATIQEEGSDLTQRSKLNFVGSGLTAADDAGNSRTNVTLDALLGAVAGLSSNGLISRTSSSAAAARTITASTGIQVSNGDGVSGNPTISLVIPNDHITDDMIDNTTPADVMIRSVGIVLDGQGSAISTGLKGFREIPYDCTVKSWTLLADQSGSIVIDVWKDTYSNFPPTVADTIAGSEKPTLSSAQKNQDTSLTTWTTTLSRGDILAFNVDSASTVTRVQLFLTLWIR